MKSYSANDLFWYLVDIIADTTRDYEHAFMAADSVVYDLCRQYSGSLVYIPKGYAKHQRNAQIAARFTGNNHRQLAHDFNLSLKQIYVILKQKKPPKVAP